MTRIQIFRPGRHTAMSGEALAFSDVDVKAIADGYDPALHEAPIVIGHPELNKPAFGWVKSLHFNGGILEAEVDQVDPAFAQLVNEGKYKKVSSRFFKPDAAHNPKPGAFSLSMSASSAPPRRRYPGSRPRASPPRTKPLPSPSAASPASPVCSAACAIFPSASSGSMPPTRRSRAGRSTTLPHRTKRSHSGLRPAGEAGRQTQQGARSD